MNFVVMCRFAPGDHRSFAAGFNSRISASNFPAISSGSPIPVNNRIIGL